LAKRMMTSIFINSIGLKENPPTLYQPLIPLVKGANKNNPNKRIKKIKKRIEIILESDFRKFQSIRDKKIKKEKPTKKKNICL
jgi:hypothetical protein